MRWMVWDGRDERYGMDRPEGGSKGGFGSGSKSRLERAGWKTDLRGQLGRDRVKGRNDRLGTRWSRDWR